MEAIAEAICIMRYEVEVEGERSSLKELVKRLDMVDWDADRDMWVGVLLQMGGERIITGPTAMKFAARFIAYLIGWKPEEKILQGLRDTYALNTGGMAGSNGQIQGGKDLPSPVA